MSTKIEWTNETWNPVTGCTKCSEACEHCYAETMTRRLKAMGQAKYDNGFGEVAFHPGSLKEPLKWKRKSRMVFVCSMSDLFHTSVPDWFIGYVMDVIRYCPQHTFQILTKRAGNMVSYVRQYGVPQNVWLGVTCENNRHYDRVKALASLDVPNVKFVSCEPLLSDVSDMPLDGINWVILGGETGSQARMMNTEWAQGLMWNCEQHGVPFFFKRWGTYLERLGQEPERDMIPEGWRQWPIMG